MHNYAVISFLSAISFLESHVEQRNRHLHTQRDPTKAPESEVCLRAEYRYLEIRRVICSPLISPNTRSYVLNNGTVRILVATGLFIPSHGFFADHWTR